MPPPHRPRTLPVRGLAACLAGFLAALGGAAPAGGAGAEDGATAGPALTPLAPVTGEPRPGSGETVTGVPLPAAPALRSPPPSQSGLRIPRFVSLGAGEVFLRTGPGFDHPVDWVLLRRSMPVEITAEFDVWRRIRDWQGTEGWVHQRMLSGRRSVMAVEPLVTLRREPRADALPVVDIEQTVIAEVERCTDGWCRLSVEGYRGWAERSALWGTYPDEELR